jgi:hypothetical protein
VFAADHVGAEAPEESSNQHASVSGDGEAGAEGWLEFVACVCCDDGLDEQDEGVDGVAGDLVSAVHPKSAAAGIIGWYCGSRDRRWKS